MGRVEQDHVLHVLVDVPWVRLDEVKGVVGDDPTDPVVLCLGAVVLVSLPPAVVQVSSACLTNKEFHWFSFTKTNYTWRLHSCIAVASSCLNRLINFHRFGIRGASLLRALSYNRTNLIIQLKECITQRK